MKPAPVKKPKIHIAVVESDPLRFVGFRTLFDTESDLELSAATLADLQSKTNVDLVLLGNRSAQNLFDVMASLKASRPDLRIIVVGSGADDETILKAIAAGAKRPGNLRAKRRQSEGGGEDEPGSGLRGSRAAASAGAAAITE